MQTKNSTTEKANGKIASTTKLFSEPISAMTDFYKKQFEFSQEFFNNFLAAGLKTGTGKQGIDSDIFSSGIEIYRKKMEDLSELSRKTMSEFMQVYFEQPKINGEERKSSDAMLNAYNLQMQQVSDINQLLYKSFNETFKTPDTDIDKLYTDFTKKSEANFRTAEEGIRNAVKAYNSISDKSSGNMQELLANINKQMDFLTKSSTQFWSDAFKTSQEKKKIEIKSSRPKK